VRFTKMHGCGNDFLIFDPGEVEGRGYTQVSRTFVVFLDPPLRTAK